MSTVSELLADEKEGTLQVTFLQIPVLEIPQLLKVQYVSTW